MNDIYQKYFPENIIIPLEKGQKFKYGKFLNKIAVFDHLEKNDKGDNIIVTLDNKKIKFLKIRLIQEKTIDQTEVQVSQLYQAQKQKGLSISTITKNIAKELDIPENSILNILSQNEAIEKKWVNVKLDEKSKWNIEENLRLSDLKKHAGTSDFTNGWRKERQEIIGSGATSAKIKSLKINRKADYITFVFRSVPTYTKTAQAVNFPNVDSTKQVRAYTQEIRILKFFEWAKTKPGFNEKEMTHKEIKEILDVADIQLSCNCKSFQFQGMAAILTTFDASIYPETRMPKRWNKVHKDDNFVCKHLGILISSGLNIYLNNMASMINKYLKK